MENVRECELVEEIEKTLMEHIQLRSGKDIYLMYANNMKIRTIQEKGEKFSRQWIYMIVRTIKEDLLYFFTKEYSEALETILFNTYCFYNNKNVLTKSVVKHYLREKYANENKVKIRLRNRWKKMFLYYCLFFVWKNKKELDIKEIQRFLIKNKDKIKEEIIRNIVEAIERNGTEYFIYVLLVNDIFLKKGKIVIDDTLLKINTLINIFVELENTNFYNINNIVDFICFIHKIIKTDRDCEDLEKMIRKEINMRIQAKSDIFLLSKDIFVEKEFFVKNVKVDKFCKIVGNLVEEKKIINIHNMELKKIVLENVEYSKDLEKYFSNLNERIIKNLIHLCPNVDMMTRNNIATRKNKEEKKKNKAINLIKQVLDELYKSGIKSVKNNEFYEILIEKYPEYRNFFKKNFIPSMLIAVGWKFTEHGYVSAEDFQKMCRKKEEEIIIQTIEKMFEGKEGVFLCAVKSKIYKETGKDIDLFCIKEVLKKHNFYITGRKICIAYKNKENARELSEIVKKLLKENGYEEQDIIKYFMEKYAIENCDKDIEKIEKRIHFIKSQMKI